MKRLILHIVITCLLFGSIIFIGCEANQQANGEVEPFVNDFLKLESYYRSRVELESWNRLTGQSPDSLNYYKSKLNFLLADVGRMEAAGRLIRAEKDPLLKEKLRYIHRTCLLATIEINPDVSRLRDSLSSVTVTSKQNQQSQDFYQALSRLARVRNQAASRLGYNSYFDLLLYCRDISRNDFTDLMGRFDDATGPRYRQILDSLVSARGNIKITYDDLRLLFGAAPAHLEDSAFSSNYRALIKGTLGGLGFKIESLPIYISEASDIRSVASARLKKVDVPGDIRIVVNLANNNTFLSDLFQQIGKAIYLVNIDQRDQYYRRPPSAGFEIGMSGIIGRLIDLKDWKRKYAGLPEPQVLSETAGQEFYRLYNLRHKLLQMKFDYELYHDPFADLEKRYCQLLDEFIGLSCTDMPKEAFGSVTSTSDPLYYYDVLVGEAIACQVYHYIDTKYGSVLDNVRTREFLVQNMYRHGSRDGWKTLLERGTGENLNAEYLLSAFRD